jgi:hypothetical protein
MMNRKSPTSKKNNSPTPKKSSYWKLTPAQKQLEGEKAWVLHKFANLREMTSLLDLPQDFYHDSAKCRGWEEWARLFGEAMLKVFIDRIRAAKTSDELSRLIYCVPGWASFYGWDIPKHGPVRLDWKKHMTFRANERMWRGDPFDPETMKLKQAARLMERYFISPHTKAGRARLMREFNGLDKNLLAHQFRGLQMNNKK